MAIDFGAVTREAFAAFGVTGCLYRPVAGGPPVTVTAILAAPTVLEPFGAAGLQQAAPAIDLQVSELPAGEVPRPVEDPGGTQLQAQIVIPASTASNPVPPGWVGTWRIRGAERDRLGETWRCTLEEDN